MKSVLTSLCLLLAVSQSAIAADAGSWSFDAAIDTYYAWDFQQPSDRQRGYTTQPLYHNTLGLNMALLQASYQDPNWRAQLGLQTGTYVESNLSAEPALMKSIYSANVGAKLFDAFWIDAGVFPSHMGFESILSTDNWNYTRSLVADYSPYYESGVKVSGEWENWKAAFLVLNGWQNIAETNNSKALGTQIQYRPFSHWLLNWGTFLGNEAPDTQASQLRFFNNFYTQYDLLENVSLALQFDLGLEQQNSLASWWGTTLLGQWKITPEIALAARVEHFNDPKQVIVKTQTNQGFQVTSASVNVDVKLHQYVLWRTEGRIFNSMDAIYPTANKDQKSNLNTLVVTSLSFHY